MDPIRTRPDVLVVGAGVIGLVTAWSLREHGLSVEIWTRDDSWQTTSAVAGAIWYPFMAEPRDRVLRWSAKTFDRLALLAENDATGVRMQPVIEVFDSAEPDLWWSDAVPLVQRLTGAELPAGFAAAVRLEVPVCDVPIHMQWLLEGLGRMGVPIVKRTIDSFDAALSAADHVVNCTGLGSRELCGDHELQPVRGQVLRLAASQLSHAWIDDTADRPCYLIPRADGLIVGGSAQMGDDRMEADRADTEAMLSAAGQAFPHLTGQRADMVKVGLRPYRSAVRLEEESLGGGRQVVHNYGHGGSGYTVSWGCAEDVVELVAGRARG